MTADLAIEHETHQIAVKTAGALRGGGTEVTFDGHRVEHLLAGMNIDLNPADVFPTVALRLSARAVGQTLFEGLATVLVESEQTLPGPAVVEFLSAMDPEEVEKAALARTDLGHGPAATTTAILTQLIEWASGRS